MPGRFLSEFEPLLPAEREVLAQIQKHSEAVLGDDRHDVPAEGDESRRLRAGFVRFLCLGGGPGAEPPAQSVRIAGAWIAEELDLEGGRMPRDIFLIACRFDAPPILCSAVLDTLNLSHAHLPGLEADRLEARATVFLTEAVVQGEARFLGARLGGDLSCVGARFEREGDTALNADGLEARGTVFLQQAVVQGEARLLGARLGGNLSCDSARFEREGSNALSVDGLEARGSVFLRQAVVQGEARFLGARLGGNLSCIGARFEREGGRALTLDGAHVEGGFFLRGGAAVRGALDMTAARFGTLEDDRAYWPGSGDLLLNRCRYEAFTSGPVDARSRLDWLALQHETRWGADFWSQPYEQLARVFRDMGHAADARAVLIEKERRQRAARRAKLAPPRRAWNWLWDALMGVTVRYGRQPLLAFAWLAGFWLLGAGLFHDAEQAGALKPNNAFILRSPEWALCAHQEGAEVLKTGAEATGEGRRAAGETQLDCFRRQPEAESYPRFDPLIYSADTLFPLVEIEMQSYWIPDETADWQWAQAARAYLWLHIALGWALSLLAVAGFSGLVKSD